MKKPAYDNINIELARAFAGQSRQHAKLVAKVLSLPAPDAIARRKRRKRKQPETRESSIVDRIEKEIRDYETEQNVRPFRDFILEPLPKVSWTKDLAGYEDARFSAENAMRRIYASTAASGAGFEADHPESVFLEVFFYKVRSGLIQADSLEILEMLRYAQRIGRTQAYLFCERLADELKNARKRVPGAPQFPQFRAVIASNWMLYGFWLMPDDLVARIATTTKMKPHGCNRQTITKIVKELHLVKHRDTARRPIVKGIGKDGILVFREGYPPKN
jgi:hypothetical protein